MKTLQQHIEECIKEYPLIFQDRLAVLDHIFACNGTGFGWTKDADGWYVEYYLEDGHESDRKDDWSQKERKVSSEYKERSSSTWIALYNSWYPMSYGYAPLTDIPVGDIHPDYASGMIELAHRIFMTSLEEYLARIAVPTRKAYDTGFVKMLRGLLHEVDNSDEPFNYDPDEAYKKDMHRYDEQVKYYTQAWTLNREITQKALKRLANYYYY